MNGKDGNVERKGRKIGPEIHCADLKLSRNLSAHVRKSEVDEVTMMHGWIIRYLYENREQDIFQKDIEEEFNIRRSSATVMLQGLEQRGYIRRTQIEKDARLKKIELTEKARKLQKRVRSEIDRFHEQLEKDLSKEEKEEFLRLLDKIKSNLKEA